MNETNWTEQLVNKAIRVQRINKQAVGNTRQDMTRPILENLLTDGYSVVTWDSGNSTHSTCRDLNRQTWELDQFLSGLQHDAPLFERSHPGDVSCSLIVSGDGLSDVRVDSYGDIDEAIGTSRPVSIPKAPKQVPIKEVRIKQEPKPTVVKTLTKPEKKYLYVPKKEWEEIKEQPSQHEITDLDREEWLRDLERETSLKPKNWITSLFKR